jgi:hypothetical protein
MRKAIGRSEPRTLILGGRTMLGDPLILEEVTDPTEAARCRAQLERFRRNSDWLESHWAEVLPQARGKHLAVAGQEAFIADTPEEGWAWVAAEHAEDDGGFVRYVIPEKGPRIYARLR